jgi:hypothetical protein
MSIKHLGISRDHVRETVSDFMTLIGVDPSNRFEMSFILDRIPDGILGSMSRLCETYSLRDRQSVAEQFLTLDSAGAEHGSGGMSVLACLYVAAAPAYSFLPDDRAAVIMWFVRGSVERHGMDALAVANMSEEHLAAVRGMVVEAFVASQTLGSTTLAHYAYLGGNLDEIGPILPEMKLRGSTDPELINNLLGKNGTSRVLNSGIL